MFSKRLSIILGWVACFPAVAIPAEVSLFSRTYVREEGRPAEWTENTPIPPGVGPPFTLRVQNGLLDGSQRVSSGMLQLAGKEVVGPFQLNQNVGTLEIAVEITSPTVDWLVRLTSNPGGRVSVSLVGTSMSLGPPPPEEVDIGGDSEGVGIMWRPVEGAVSYNLYRGRRPEALSFLKRVGPEAYVPADGNGNEAHFGVRDGEVTLGDVYFYSLSSVDSSGQEGLRMHPRSAWPHAFHTNQPFPKLTNDLNEVHVSLQAGANLEDLAERFDLVLDRAIPSAIHLRVSVDRMPVPESYVEAIRQQGVHVVLVLPASVSVAATLEQVVLLAGLDFVKLVAPEPSVAFEGALGDPNNPLFESVAYVGTGLLHQIPIEGLGTRTTVFDIFSESEHGSRVREIVRNFVPVR